VIESSMTARCSWSACSKTVSGRNASRLIDSGWDLGILISRRLVVLVSPSKLQQPMTVLGQNE